MEIVTDYSEVVIETSNLIMKKAVFGDWEQLYRNITSRPESAKYMLWKIDDSEEESKDRMLRTLDFQSKEKYALTVYLKTESGLEAIGWASMREVNPDVYEDMGIAIGPDFVGKGYGKQILNALCEEARKQGAKEFHCSYREKNLASKRLQDACGFKFDYKSEEKIDPRTDEKYVVVNTKKDLNDERGMSLPEAIRKHIEGKEYTIDDMGKSGSKVLIFEDMVLKITDKPCDDKDAVEMMHWLEGKIPAPRVIVFEEDDSYSYLLMTRVRGKIACDKYYLERPKELVPLLSKSVKMFQSIDITDCPVIKDLDRELKKAAYRVENGLVDISDAEPDTFGENGRFKDPEELLSWLKENRPSYEPVLSHGDLCLPNILIENGDISGFIDMGNCGIADKWEDIAMLYRSLRHNFDGTYGKVYPGLDPDSFFEELGIEPDREKIDYYILLDELF